MIFILLWFWAVNANLSDWFFCQIKSQEVVISLKKTEWFYKCKDTVTSLEKLILQTAKNLMNIQVYINSGRDRDYWIHIKKEKLLLLEKYQVARKNILENVAIFQNNLVKKTVHYFLLSITSYKINIQKSLLKIDAMSGSLSPSLISYTTLLKEQIATITALGKSQTVSELVPLLEKYIYLKKEILWKYE